MSTLNDIRQTFFQECEELLESLDDGLEQIRNQLDAQDAVEQETINAVFRAVHSIKGGAAAFGLEALVRFAHRFETTLDDLRSQRLALDPDVLQVCLRAADQLADLVTAGRDGVDAPADAGAQIIARLAALLPGAETAGSDPVTTEEPTQELAFAPMPMSFEPLALDLGEMEEAGPICHAIRFRAQAHLFRSGNDPVHLFRELSQMGALDVALAAGSIPDFDTMSPDVCTLDWALTLSSDHSHDSIAEVFEFVDGLCDLEITRSGAADAPEPGQDMATTQAACPEVAAPAKPPQEPAGPPVVASRQAAAEAPPRPGGAAKATVRVDLDHVDRLINTVGELVINQAVLTQCIQASKIPPTAALSASLDEFMQLAREIQEGVMAIRAQSVKPLFQRMARIAREAADLAGKPVRFETEGETTEVDKTVIERLVDPLTHIIRNAVDHGLETEEARRAAGKSEPGTVVLRAAHRSGRVLIDVSDNGNGINRARVFKIAVERGLVPADAVLTDAEIDKLLFLPGFSTAPTVTDLSGRGVGMDVVRSAIQKLGGRISIASTPGVGTTMSISLPLTLAVLDGMVVDVAGQTMVVPIATIVETIRPVATDLHRLSVGTCVVSVRDRFIPVIDLGAVFQCRSAPADPETLVYLLVESDQHQLWALGVDRIHDQRQIVIKGLEANYGHVPGIAAATILGDGKVALIIDPEEAVHGRPEETPPPATVSVEET